MSKMSSVGSMSISSGQSTVSFTVSGARSTGTTNVVDMKTLIQDISLKELQNMSNVERTQYIRRQYAKYK